MVLIKRGIIKSILLDRFSWTEKLVDRCVFLSFFYLKRNESCRSREVPSCEVLYRDTSRRKQLTMY